MAWVRTFSATLPVVLDAAINRSWNLMNLVTGAAARELRLLLRTILNIGALLRMGFGEAYVSVLCSSVPVTFNVPHILAVALPLSLPI